MKPLPQPAEPARVKLTSSFTHDERATGILIPLLADVVIMFTFLTFPTVVIEMNVDASLSGVLHYASEQGLQFGVDLVSTYGPLGFLVFPHYSEHAFGLRMATDVLVCFTVAAGLCLVAWRLRWIWRCILIGVFIWTSPRLGTELLLPAGLFFWGLLCLVEPGRLQVCILVFSGLAGFCGLAKVSWLFLAGLGVGLVVASLLLRRYWALAVMALASYGGTLLVGWAISGQHLANCPIFLQQALTVALNYNAALGVQALGTVTWMGIATLLLAALALLLHFAVGRGKGHAPGHHAVPFAWVFLFLSISWKYGFVRGDIYHAGIFFAFAPLLMLGLEAAPVLNPVLSRYSRALRLAAAALPLVALQIFVFPPLPGSLTEPLVAFGSNLRRIVNPDEYAHNASSLLAEKEHECQLPKCRRLIAGAAVDVFGQQQAYALHNQMRYQPRPVFQSYAACNARLMRLNEEFFLRPSAPEYWLFQLSPLDRKFAPLEDAWLLRDLLMNCEPVAAEKEFLLLRKVSSDAPRLKLLQEGLVAAGQPLDLRPWSGKPLWLELRLEPSLAGRFRQVALRPPTLRLAAWREPGQGLIYRRQAAAPMLAAGFLASPLLVRTEDALALYTGGAKVSPGAYSVEFGDADACWRHSIHFRIYEIENGFRQVGEIGSNHEGRPLSRPFTVFGKQRWRPELEAPGSKNDILSYSLFLLVPILSAAALVALVGHARARVRPASWPWLLAGNVLLLVFLLSTLFFAGETWFRFFYDATDSLAYTKVTEKWVRRHWQVNAAGCRDNVEYAPALEPGKPRISFIGDSFTAGHGIKNVEDRAANRLRKVYPDRQIHVLANVGLDTGGELVLLKRLAATGYQFDEVVLVYCLNDIGDLAPEQIAAYEAVLAKVNQEGWLVRNSYLLNFLYERYQAVRHPYARNYAGFVRDMYAGPLWPRQQERLKACRDFVESKGGRLRVVTFPLFHNLGSDYPYGPVHEQLSRFWREQNVPHLDLLPAFQGLPASQLVVNAHDAHPNVYANALAARAIVQFLAENR